MIHFSAVACVADPAELEQALGPFGLDRKVAPYREYQDCAPGEHWAAVALRREGLIPDDGAPLTWELVASVYNAQHPGSSELQLGEDGRAYSMSTRNPDGRWQSWKAGGQWSGHFDCRPGQADKVIRSAGGDGARPLRCDGGPKGALDFAAMRARAAAEARRTCARYRSAVEGTPQGRPWAAFAPVAVGFDRHAIDQAAEEHEGQPRVRALRAAGFDEMDPIGQYGYSEQVFVARTAACAVPGWATLTLDGRWLAPEEDSYAFIASAGSSGGLPGYWEAANAYIESLPDDTFLIIVDCTA